jgi:hypothetical protein
VREVLPIDSVQSLQPIDIPFSNNVQEANNAVRAENQVTDVAVTIEVPEIEVSELPPADATRMAKDKATKPFSVESISETLDSLGEDAVINQAQKASVPPTNDFVLEDPLVRNNPEYKDFEILGARRSQRAMEMLQDRMEQEDKGIGGYVMDFVDREIFRQIPIGAIEDITKRSERKGRELAAARYDASISDEEWEEGFQAYLDEVGAEGFFRSENYFAFQDLWNEATNAGYDPSANVNAALGVVELATVVSPTKLLGAGSRAVSRTSALTDVDTAADVASTLNTKVTTTNPEVDLDTTFTAINAAEDSTTTINIDRAQTTASNNQLIQTIGRLHQEGRFGVGLPEETVKAATADILNTVAATTGRSTVDIQTIPRDFSETGTLGEVGASFLVGKKRPSEAGKPFVNKTNADKEAKRYRDQGFAASTVEADGGFYVRIDERFDLTTQAEADVVIPTGSSWFSQANQAFLNVFASTRNVQSDVLNQLSILGEGAESASVKAAKDTIRVLENRPTENQNIISKIFHELRDGADSNFRDYYTQSEFRVKWKSMSSVPVTDADYEAFLAVKSMNDTAYFLRANRIMQSYIKQDYKAITAGGKTYNARVVEVDGSARVWDDHLGREVPRSEIVGDSVIWELENADEGVLYVTRPKAVREMNYSDVLGYNAGGARMNPNLNYFITVGKGRGRALLGAVSNKQAQTALRELTSIQTALKANTLTDEIVSANNTWNPSVETVADFNNLVERKGWDFNLDIGVKRRDQRVESDDVFDGIDEEANIANQFKRNDEVLMEFGGQDTYNHNPIKGISDQLGNAVREYSLRNYNQVAKVSWLKKAGYGGQLKRGANVDELFRTAEISQIVNPTTRRQMEAVRSAILRRNGVTGPVTNYMRDLGDQLAEWVFDRTGYLAKANPQNALLQAGFQSAFGFMNLSQFILQSLHAVSIAAISPRAGIKAAAAVAPMRLAVYAGQGMDNVAKLLGVSRKQADEIVQYIQDSGRLEVTNDSIVEATGPIWDITSFEGKDMRISSFNKAWNKGKKVTKFAKEKVSPLPFHEGEKMTRYTGMVTASLEYMEKFPGESILTPKAKKWIALREQDLTFHMTNASRTAWQTGLMRIPTQWMAYTFRAFESVVFGKQLNWKEKARLGGALAAMSGMAGIGAAKAADVVGDWLGMEPDSKSYAALKYGAFDGIMSWAFSGLSDENIRTAFGTRISPLTGILDLVDKAKNESLIEAVGGPSASIVGGGLEALISSLGHLYNGRSELLKDDLSRVAKTFTAINNYSAAVAIMNTGTYRTKAGRAMHGEWSFTDALLKGAGINNFRETEYYARSNAFWENDKKVKQWKKEIRNLAGKAFDMMEADPERGGAMLNDIVSAIEGSGLDPSAKRDLRGSIVASRRNDDLILVLKYLKSGNPFAAEVVESLGGRD